MRSVNRLSTGKPMSEIAFLRELLDELLLDELLLGETIVVGSL